MKKKVEKENEGLNRGRFHPYDPPILAFNFLDEHALVKGKRPVDGKSQQWRAKKGKLCSREFQHLGLSNPC